MRPLGPRESVSTEAIAQWNGAVEGGLLPEATVKSADGSVPIGRESSYFGAKIKTY